MGGAMEIIIVHDADEAVAWVRKPCDRMRVAFWQIESAGGDEESMCARRWHESKQVIIEAASDIFARGGENV